MVIVVFTKFLEAIGFAALPYPLQQQGFSILTLLPLYELIFD